MHAPPTRVGRARSAAIITCCLPSFHALRTTTHHPATAATPPPLPPAQPRKPPQTAPAAMSGKEQPQGMATKGWVVEWEGTLRPGRSFGAKRRRCRLPRPAATFPAASDGHGPAWRGCPAAAMPPAGAGACRRPHARPVTASVCLPSPPLLSAACPRGPRSPTRARWPGEGLHDAACRHERRCRQLVGRASAAQSPTRLPPSARCPAACRSAKASRACRRR